MGTGHVEHLRCIVDDLLLIQALAAHHWVEAKSDEETLDKLRAVATVLIITPQHSVQSLQPDLATSGRHSQSPASTHMQQGIPGHGEGYWMQRVGLVSFFTDSRAGIAEVGG